MFKDKKWHLKEDGAVPDEKYLKKLDAYAAYAGAVKDRENAYKDLYDRGEFSYDVNKDAMYDKLVQDYAENASKAAEDAMGRAVSLTGGYGNSYAQQVSQQTFQDYMGGLDAEADKLYDRALDRYLLQGDLLKEKYDLATDRVKETYADYEAIKQGDPVEKVEDAVVEEEPEVIDLDKYNKALCERTVVKRSFATNVPKVLENIPKYQKLKEYGVDVYCVIPWVHTIQPEEYDEIIEQMKKAGAEKFHSWNTNHLVWDLPEWYVVSKIGNARDDSIVRRKFYRVLSLNGHDISQFYESL